MIQKPGGPKKNQKNAITYESNLQCPQCHSKLEPCLINEKDMMLNCSNKNCLFPLNSENMLSFTFPQDQFKVSIEKISQLMKEEGGNSTNISNNSYYDYPTQKMMQTDSPTIVNNLQVHIREYKAKEINLFSDETNEDFFTFDSHR